MKAAPWARVSDGVELVDEDDAGRRLLGLLKQIPHARGANADEHLDEVRAAQAEERHPRLAGNGPGQERLARPRRPDQEYALRKLRAELRELGRFRQEAHDLACFLDGLVDAGEIREVRTRRAIDLVDLRPTLPHLQNVGPSPHAAHQESPDQEQHAEREDPVEQKMLEPVRLDAAAVVDAVLLECREQSRIVERDDREVELRLGLAGLLISLEAAAEPLQPLADASEVPGGLRGGHLEPRLLGRRALLIGRP